MCVVLVAQAKKSKKNTQPVKCELAESVSEDKLSVNTYAPV